MNEVCHTNIKRPTLFTYLDDTLKSAVKQSFLKHFADFDLVP